MSCLVVLLFCRFVVSLILKVQSSFTNNKTTKRQNDKKNHFFCFLFLFITNKIITFAPANSSGQGENPDRR